MIREKRIGNFPEAIHLLQLAIPIAPPEELTADERR
jgi:hypothetical protein